MDDKLTKHNTQDNNITVKFHITDSDVVAHHFSPASAISTIKNEMAKKFKIDQKYLLVRQNGKIVEDKRKLSQIGINKFGIVDVDLALNDVGARSGIQLDTSAYYSQIVLPDIITVYVPVTNGSDGETKQLVVEIENKAIVKPFLGGYLNKRTNIEYHDAFTQSGPPLEHMKSDENYCCRDTQTIFVDEASNNTHCDKAMQRFGDASEEIYIPTVNDVEMTKSSGGSYESHEEMTAQATLLKHVLVVQRNFRRYHLLKCVKKCAAEHRALVAEQKARQAKQQENYVNKYLRECILKAQPKTKQDFDVLFAQIQKWKESEIKRIAKQYSGGPKIAELNAVLDKEIQMLNGIEKQRQGLRRVIQKQKTDKMLADMGKPVRWVGYKNILIEMDTLRTQRVRKFTDFYNRLKTVTAKIERLDLLGEISEALNDENNSAVDEIEELFDREKKFVLANLNCDTLATLRQRELIVFMDIIKDEENQEKRKKPKMKLCEKCKVVRPQDEFSLHTRQNIANICRLCSDLTATSMDNTIYRSILRAVRRDERKRGALASYAFIIQETDIKHIVENIWHGHSILSQCNVKYDLRLPRWNIADDWSPWNCILLTEAEAKAHVKMKKLALVYEANVMADIKSKHALSVSAFKQLKEVDHVYVETGEWWNVGLDGKTV